MNLNHRPLALSPQTPKLGSFRRWAVYVLVASLFASGAAWLWVHLRTPDDAIPSALEPWAMKLHGAAALLVTYLAGTMLYGHMLTAWRQRRNRVTGCLVTATFLLLALTGYGLYYFSGDGLRQFNEWLHWLLGFASPAALVLHVWRGRRANSKPRSI
jgi:hypothetical protein